MEIKEIEGMLIVSKFDNDYEFEKNPGIANYGYLIGKKDKNLVLYDYKNKVAIKLDNQLLFHLISVFSNHLNQDYFLNK